MKYAKNHRAKNHRRWLAVLAIIAAVGLGGTIWQSVIGQDSTPGSDPNGVAKAESLSRAFRAAAKKVIPTVVKVTSTTKPRVIDEERGDMSRENPFKGTPFEDFFNDDGSLGRRFRYRVPPREGLGSGVIIDRKGVILTNNHVVAGADKVTVELADGREFEATEIKTDELTDLAVLRIDVKEPLPAARLGDSGSLEIGDWVLAVGNPFDMDHTVSAGIISGKGRSLRSGKRAGKRAEFLQTDAAINPGNSGGPLVNLNGEVVGINTAIASNTGGYQGIGFAIPANLAKWVSSQLIEGGSVQRAYLGIGIDDTNDKLGQRLGVGRLKGVLVRALYHNSPAAAAGFQLGDVVVAFAGNPVGNARELQETVERSPIGSRQKVDIVRDGKRTTLKVVVKPLPDGLGLGSAPSRVRGGPDSSGFISRELGLEVDELTADAARELGSRGSSGVLITGVAPRGTAYRAGLQQGMLIVEVEQKLVKSVAEFEAALKGRSLSDGVLLKIRTRDGIQYVLLQRS
jgi:serine protease Do